MTIGYRNRWRYICIGMNDTPCWRVVTRYPIRFESYNGIARNEKFEMRNGPISDNSNCDNVFECSWSADYYSTPVGIVHQCP